MTLMKLRLGFLCLTVVTFWNKSGGYLTQAFNSQTLRDDLTKIFKNFESQQPHPKDIARIIQKPLGKDCLETFIEIPKILEL